MLRVEGWPNGRTRVRLNSQYSIGYRDGWSFEDGQAARWSSQSDADCEPIDESAFAKCTLNQINEVF
jgi:hypothetical protein